MYSGDTAGIVVDPIGGGRVPISECSVTVEWLPDASNG